MGRICRLFDRSKQAYYEHSDFVQRKLAEEAFVLKFIKEIRKKDPGLGGEKLWKVYQRTFGPNFEYMVGRDKSLTPTRRRLSDGVSERPWRQYMR